MIAVAEFGPWHFITIAATPLGGAPPHLVVGLAHGPVAATSRIPREGEASSGTDS
jgi:hypothetical protein